jgi:hypothetical protein
VKASNRPCRIGLIPRRAGRYGRTETVAQASETSPPCAGSTAAFSSKSGPRGRRPRPRPGPRKRPGSPGVLVGSIASADSRAPMRSAAIVSSWALRLGRSCVAQREQRAEQAPRDRAERGGARRQVNAVDRQARDVRRPPASMHSARTCSRGRELDLPRPAGDEEHAFQWSAHRSCHCRGRPSGWAGIRRSVSSTRCRSSMTSGSRFAR